MKMAMIGLRGIPYSYGGGEEFVRNLAPRLAERGHEVIVYCRSNLFLNKAKYYKEVRRIFLPTVEHKILGQFIHALLSMVDAVLKHFDIIYVHCLPSGIHTLIPWFFGKKVVINVDGLDWERGKWGRIVKLYFKISARVILLTSRAIVNDSEALHQYYLKKFKKDSTFIAYGANIEKSTNPGVLKEYGLHPYDYYLIASRLVPESNTLLIIKAFEK